MKKLLLTLLITMFSGAAIYAQSYTEIVWKQIQNAYDENVDEGYTVKNYIIGTISEEDDDTWTFYLPRNNEYLIEAFCDEDCDDLDLYLNDSEGNQIDSDTAEDDYPIIFFEPTKSDRYQIKVSMYSCTVEPCYFGLAIFEK